jgi:hypothetical protein
MKKRSNLSNARRRSTAVAELCPEPAYPLLLSPLKVARDWAITFRRLDWAPDDLVEASW